ncbi:MAG: type II toxin-antitoxin system VapC family toxin [Pirellulaceae bacterium]
MKLLLDTHMLLWWLDDPALLAIPAREAISEPSNEVLVSAAVVWEIVIKSSLGKLTIPDDLENVIERSGFVGLPMEAVHVLAIRNLPELHRDPFDRMLAAQAVVESATIVTRDAQLLRYPVPSIRA